MGVESMLVVVDFVIPPVFVLIDSYVGGKMKCWGQEGQRKMHSLDRSVIQ